MSFRLFHTGKNTSFFPLYYFLREPKVVCLLTDLATLSHRHCVCTIDAHVQKDSLVQKPICWPSKIEKNSPNEIEKNYKRFFLHFFLCTILQPAFLNVYLGTYEQWGRVPTGKELNYAQLVQIQIIPGSSSQILCIYLDYRYIILALFLFINVCRDLSYLGK